MSTLTADRDVVGTAPFDRGASPIPTRRIVAVELRKMFDTRSGFWLLVSVGVLSVAATVAAVIFAAAGDRTYRTFTSAIGLPLSVILPMIAILAVTSEWSQRSGLTTFTLVPSRGRVVGAKAIATTVVGIVSMLVAFAVGAAGNLIGAASAGVDPVWNIGLMDVPQVVLGNVIGMAIGFTLGVVLRNSPAAIVGYFVVSFVLPGVLLLLAQARKGFADVQPWIDWNTTQVALFDGVTDTPRQWAQLGSTTVLWIVIPLAVGLVTLRRSEFK